jgi:predicted acyltransferase
MTVATDSIAADPIAPDRPAVRPSVLDYVSRRSATAADASAAVLPPGARAGWLDAFRGFTMICLVSRGFGFPRVKDLDGWPAAVATQFDHTQWAGVTAWDLVQPFFMFIVGAAMPFAFAKRRGAGGTWAGGLLPVLKRCGLLLLWSHVLMIGTSGGVASWRWELINVLAQIAFTYLIAYLVLDAHWPVQAVVAAGLLGLHWALHAFWSGVGTGGPWAETANFGAHLDRSLLGYNWRGGYATLNFVPSASATIAGVMAANLLRTPLPFARKAAVLLAVGGGLVGLGVLLGRYPSPADPWVPIVKKIWTPSFALLSIGLTLGALLAFYAVGTRWPAVPWKSLVVVGANCIFIYVANMLFGGQLRTVIERLIGAGMAWVLTAVHQPAAWTMFVVDWLALGVLVAVAWWLYERKVFFKL